MIHAYLMVKESEKTQRKDKKNKSKYQNEKRKTRLEYIQNIHNSEQSTNEMRRRNNSFF